MSHRHLSGRTACGLSKWDTEKANRLFIHVLIWWLFLSLLSHFHFKCQRTSFGLCQKCTTWRQRRSCHCSHRLRRQFQRIQVQRLASAGNSLKSLHEYRPSKRKEWLSWCSHPPGSGGGRKKKAERLLLAEVGGHVWWRTSESQESERERQSAALYLSGCRLM